MEIVSTSKSFGGVQGVYSHDAATTGCSMTFAVYTPPQAADGPVPVLWYLSGLTCTHASRTTGSSAAAPGFIWMPRRSRGRRTTGCIHISWMNCPS